MKVGQIWRAQHSVTGQVFGMKVYYVSPPVTDGTPNAHYYRQVAYVHKVKDPEAKYSCVLNEKGLPMLKDGTATQLWTLIEDVP